MSMFHAAGFKLTPEERKALEELVAKGVDDPAALPLTEAQHAVLDKAIQMVAKAVEAGRKPGSEYRRGRAAMFEEMEFRTAKALILTASQMICVNGQAAAGEDRDNQRAVIMSILTEVAAIIMYTCFPPADPATEKDRIVAFAKEVQNDLRMVRGNDVLRSILRPLWDEDDEE